MHPTFLKKLAYAPKNIRYSSGELLKRFRSFKRVSFFLAVAMVSCAALATFVVFAVPGVAPGGPVTVTITPAGSPTALDNDYTRINNAVQATFNGQTIKLLGVFNWTEPNAAASWALGSNGLPSDLDDYSILVPANINNVTFTADNLGDGTIQGPGDLAVINLEGVFFFDGGNNQNWTISNIRFLDFDLAIGMFNGAGGSDAFNGTIIQNNYIRIPNDLNATVAPADVNQNIGIHYSFGTNQLISGNTIETPGDGVSDSANLLFSTVVGMQSNTSGGNVYNGLQITNNIIRVLNAQSADPQNLLGIWENAHAHSSIITVSGNSFTNLAGGNNPATNLQRAFRVTSHSSATTTVTYQNNAVTGANIGFQWITGSNFTGNQPVQLTSNTITGNGTGVLVQSQGLANLSFNRIVGNTVAGLNNVDGTATAENNWWGCNAGPGNTGCDSVTGAVDSNPWLVLGVSATPNTIPQGSTSTVTADMTHNSAAADTSGLGTVPLTPVAFSATEGTTAPPTGTITAGQASSTFTSTSANSGTGCATVDNQLACANIAVQPLLVTITPAGSPTVADNDYTRINNAVQATFNGQTIKLLGVFNWTEPNAAASWALGSNGLPSDLDDYSILVPANINNVTFTADNLGDGTIQGPGDLAVINLEGVFFFDGGDNQNWTISNIRFLDFDLAIGMFSGAGGADAYNNTHITNNYIRIASDLNATVAPADVNQNIGIHYSFGMNQVISGNTIESQGNAVSSGSNFATDVGMQSNTSGGNVYDGLQITGNTIRVLNAQDATNPQIILGIWENAHGHSSNITVSGNSFTNLAGGNNPATNLQRAFRVTSHSSATTTVTYQNNAVTGANIGFQWITGSNFTGNQPVQLTSNTITGNGTGVLVQSQGLANLSFNRIVGNTTGLNNVDGTATAENNWWGCNAGPGNTGCDSVTGTADFNPWLVLAAAAVPNVIILPGGTANIVTDMTHNSDDAVPSGTLPDIPVGYSATNGTMSPTSGTVNAGTSSSTFTSTNGNSAIATVTVDNESINVPITVSAPPSFTIDDVTHNEGDSGTTAYTFTVTKTGSTLLNATVDYATVEGSATSPSDFTEIPATTLTFLPADTTKQITVFVNGDTTAETAETFSANLSNATNATIADGLGQGTIVNDDTDVTVAVAPSSVAEDGAPNLVYTFTRNGVTSGSLTVNFSVGGTATFSTDYTQTGAATFGATSGTVTFGAGSSTAQVTIDPSSDITTEPDDTVILTVTSGTGYNVGSPSSATGTITNDDTDVSVVVSPSAVAEDGAPNLVYTFTRNGVTSGSLTVNFSVGGTATFSTDYTQTGAATFGATSGTVTFGAGSSTAQVTIDPSSDITTEPDDTVILTVTSGTGYNVGSPSSATGTITNDDTDVSVAVSPSAVAEDGAPNLIYTFTRNGVTAGALTVNFSVGGTAVFSTDYTQTGAATFGATSGTVTFGAGNSTAQVTIDPSSDITTEPDDTVILTVTSGTGYNVGSPSSATGTITNDDTDVSVAVAPSTVTEDGAPNLIYTFTRNGVTSGSLTVNFSVAGTATFSTDYTQTGAATFGATSGTVTFSAGNATAAVTIDPTADLGFEPDETVILTVTSGTGYNVGSPSSATGTITNDDASGGIIRFSAADFNTTESSSSVIITVERVGDTTAAVTVDYATADDSEAPTVVPCATVNGLASPRCDFTTALGTLRFAAGETSKTFAVLISQDNYVEGPETLTLTLSNLTGGAVFGVPSTATLTIADDVTEPAQNPIDDAANFVRQQYHDFLNREPDPAGFAFWTDQITSCGTDPQCIEAKRINVSAAFYLSIEFQDTGYFVERLYKSSYGDATGMSTLGGAHTLPVPIVRFSEFLPDTQEIGQGVIVGQPGWEAVLEANKVAFTERFVQRSRFTTAYANTLTPAEFVDMLFANAGVVPTPTQRQAAIDEFGGAGTSANVAARGRALRLVSENGTLVSAEFNRAFVLMQYIGYLRRNPNVAPDADYTGFDFWLAKLNQFGGNFQDAEMVKAFLVSTEYRRRFGTP